MARIRRRWVADERLSRSIVVKIPSVNISRHILKKSDGCFSDIDMDETINNFETFLRLVSSIRFDSSSMSFLRFPDSI
ncbi:unnamed protein product [Toxocara canis]|uniref:Uncharacterized protein n=1 Tax=Toxocara canis TaxID=6265 RepID=A0A183U9C4_TOXCA|nr:unnamed protein product [Toxocara canis]